MSDPFHQYLLEQAQRALPPRVLLAQELMVLLQQSKANIYKKIKGESPFSSEETMTIARHFGISLDRYVHRGHPDFDKIVFDYSLPEAQPRSPVAFLEKVHKDLIGIAQYPKPRILYATNEVPLFHSLACPRLLSFKLYVWSRTNWKLPEAMSRPFDYEHFAALWPGVEAQRQAIMALIQRIPSKEYWPRLVLDNMLNQIRYYAEAKLFKDPAMPVMLCNELLEMLERCQNMAASGNKGLLPDGQAGAAYELYLNEIAFTNNIILVYDEDVPIATYATMDNPNFVRCTDTSFSQRMYQWVEQIEDCSFNTRSEKPRFSLFNDLSIRVESLQKNLEQSAQEMAAA